MLPLFLAASHACLVDEDCSLNGVCSSSGRCQCLQGWRGAACAELALADATVGAGLHALPSANLSSWGGWIGFEANRWHMFANEMVLGCGINSWESNSRVVRASTADLREPFRVDAELKPPFGSEPTLARSPRGEWLLWSIGGPRSTLPPRPDCRSGYTPSAAPPAGTGGNFKGPVPVQVARGTGSLTAGAAAWRVQATLGSGDFNPSPLVLPNGTTLLMWRHLARVHMVRAASYEGPFALNGSDGACPPFNASVPPPAAKAGCAWWHLFPREVDARGLEDPFMYVQPHPVSSGGGGGGGGGGAAARTFHALFHDHRSFGGHAYSRDGVAWTFSSTPPYGNVVNFTDGTSVAMQRRERPHLVFDENGLITHLSTGVQPPPTARKAPPPGCQNDFTYTLVQPVVA